MSFKKLIVITYVPNINQKIHEYLYQKQGIDNFVFNYFRKDVEFINILNTQPELFKLIV
jgi:hypothetical protein